MKRGKGAKRVTKHNRGGASRTGGLRPHRGQAMKFGGNSRVGGNRPSRGTSMGKR